MWIDDLIKKIHNEAESCEICDDSGWLCKYCINDLSQAIQAELLRRIKEKEKPTWRDKFTNKPFEWNRDEFNGRTFVKDEKAEIHNQALKDVITSLELEKGE